MEKFPVLTANPTMVSGVSVASPLWIFQSSLFVPWAIPCATGGSLTLPAAGVLLHPFSHPMDVFSLFTEIPHPAFTPRQGHQVMGQVWRSEFPHPVLPFQSWFCWIKVTCQGTDISFHFISLQLPRTAPVCFQFESRCSLFFYFISNNTS